MAENASTSTKDSRPRSGSWRWPVAGVLIVMMLVGAYLLYNLIMIPERLMHGLADAFSPHTTYTTVISGAIRELKNNPKLVVLTATIDAEIHKSSSTNALWVYWGTTTEDVKAAENKVQFYVPLDDIGTSDFQYDEMHKTLTVWTRPPVLDEEVVDVQTDPGKLYMTTSNGWAKFDRFSGAPMRDEVRRELRGAVIQAAKQPAQFELLELKAENNAKENIRKLLDPLTSSLKPDVKLDIQFRK